MQSTPLPLGVPTAVSGRVETLAEAFGSETRLLRELERVLERQRTAVGQDDLGSVDDSVYAAQRILLTLAQAKRRRKSLLHLMVGNEELPLAELDTALGMGMTESVRRARDELHEAAQTLARELDLNRRVLQGAITAGDQLIRALVGATPRAGQTYGRGQVNNGTQDMAGGSGVLINRQV
ncbi:MAG: flagellar protein FlgN [Gemmatimonadota bacterium]|nr:flagellar protein FlgN [Gemmatimonadota bacterium]